MKKPLFIIGFFWCLIQNADAQCENFEMTITTSNPLCYNYSDGDIDVFPTGGNGQVWGQITNESGDITLDENMTGTSPNQLPAGWYYIYVYDALGCELFDTVYLEDPDEMEIIMNITLPTSATSCDGIAEIDTVLHHVGLYENLSFWWSGGPGGLNQTIKSDLCYDYYSISVNNEIGCGVTKDFVVGNVSMDENKSQKIQLFPNPVNQFTTLQTEQSIIEIFLMDYTGKQVMRIDADGNTAFTMNVNDLPNGIYQLSIVFEDSVQFRTFIKQ